VGKNLGWKSHCGGVEREPAGKTVGFPQGRPNLLHPCSEKINVKGGPRHVCKNGKNLKCHTKVPNPSKVREPIRKRGLVTLSGLKKFSDSWGGGTA